MQRYFIEVSYKGAGFAGFQIQENARTIQSELQQALKVFFKNEIILTGSSRTDAGVNAWQNFFHFDTDLLVPEKVAYNINAILPDEIAVNKITLVHADAHCRFDANSREYRYFVYHRKDPFLKDRGYFFPYPLQLDLLQQAAEILKEYNDFTSFSKRNTQVKNFNCQLMESQWTATNTHFEYYVKGNRFLRGMVRGLVGTMLQVGRGKLSLDGFRTIIESQDCTKADFAVPGHGLFLCKVNYDYL